MHSMKGKLILLASVSLNLLVMCTYSESASSVKLYQLSNISPDSLKDNNSTVVQLTTSSTGALESVDHLHIEENNFKSPREQSNESTVTSMQGARERQSGVKSVSISNEDEIASTTISTTLERNTRPTVDIDGVLDTARPQYLSGDTNDLNAPTTTSPLFLAHQLTQGSSENDSDRDPMDNAHLFQGDIVNGVESKTAVRIFNLWPLGIIPYSLDLTLLPIRDKIKSAMSEIESKTCVRFIPRLLSRDYINIGSGSGCYSNIGRQGGGQVLSLGRGCSARNTILHELLHAVGFEHMHSHRDRDIHLRILWQNIPRDKWRQFEVVSLLGYKAIIPFDYESVMLYGPKTFGENGKITMESKRPDKRVIEMSEKPGLSQGDIDGINRLYFCRRSATGQWIHVASRK